ncbi:hypothetical protein [Streptomyces sp. NPDC059949]|uniref:hypothetical protein n=1 Tax=Streptomyces sp. NPDC059949 TaxID=3347013 RepID=UPI00365B6076
MITDPELDAEWTTEPAREPAEQLAPRERSTGRARPWLWALGGVVVASALWAGGLYAFGDRPAAPPISYRAAKNLCEDFRAQALSQITGELHKARPRSQENSHPAVDAAVCELNNVEGTPDFTVIMHVSLHKKTDPSVEFDVPPLKAVAVHGALPTQAVPGLGERAVLTVAPNWPAVWLEVLDGGAVFTVEVFAPSYEARNDRPATDSTAIQSAVIEDMRDLMAALKK